MSRLIGLLQNAEESLSGKASDNSERIPFREMPVHRANYGSRPGEPRPNTLLWVVTLVVTAVMSGGLLWYWTYSYSAAADRGGHVRRTVAARSDATPSPPRTHATGEGLPPAPASPPLVQARRRVMATSSTGPGEEHDMTDDAAEQTRTAPEHVSPVPKKTVAAVDDPAARPAEPSTMQTGPGAIETPPPAPARNPANSPAATESGAPATPMPLDRKLLAQWDDQNGAKVNRALVSWHEAHNWAGFPKIADGHYIVLIGSFNRQDQAEALVRTLVGHRVPAFVEADPVVNRNAGYHVKVGPFSNKEDGAQAAATVQERAGLAPIHARSRIKRCVNLDDARHWATIRNTDCP